LGIRQAGGGNRRYHEDHEPETPYLLFTENEARYVKYPMWSELLDLCDQHKVTFQWVRGHAGNEENECCDRLAVQATQQSNLLIDTGFETDNSPDSSVGLFD
jgi:ribonuclease HI